MVNRTSLTPQEYRALAEFRYRIRVFLNGSERAARTSGLEPQQHLLLLAVQGLPLGRKASIGELAESMQLRHHSVVELVDRLERRSLLRRERSRVDRREVIVQLTDRGKGVLSRLAALRLAELRTLAPTLVRSLAAVVRSTRHPAPRRTRAS